VSASCEPRIWYIDAYYLIVDKFSGPGRAVGSMCHARVCVWPHNNYCIERYYIPLTHIAGMLIPFDIIVQIKLE